MIRRLPVTPPLRVLKKVDGTNHDNMNKTAQSRLASILAALALLALTVVLYLVFIFPNLGLWPPNARTQCSTSR